MNILILNIKAFSSIQKFISFFLLIFKEMKTVSWAPTISWALGTAPSGRSGDRPGDLKTCIKFMLKKKKKTKAGKNLCTFISTQSTSEKTQERLATVFGSRRENWVARDTNGRELLLYALLCVWNFVLCE